ncbi:uncharacterized protein [Bemisia tabaci]|uniref:uncharacterized protein isoform X2 n=1 Tax=Bemisia tabaci TaxID=7038 RepID=UPI003B28679D
MHLWHIAKDFYFFPQKGFVDIMKPEDRMSSKRTCVVRRRVEGRPYTGNAGKLLAMRMRYMPVVFNFLTCRHYMDYIVYGRSYGDYRTWHYPPASNDCPVHRHFDRETDVTSANFKLARKDARGNLRSVEWPTGWTQERMEEVLSGSRLCPLAPTIEAAIAQVKNVWERNLSQIKKKGLFSCFLTPRKNNVKGEPELTYP